MRQLAAVALVAALALVGCASLDPQPSPPATVAPSTADSPPATSEPAAPESAPAPSSSEPASSGTGAPATTAPATAAPADGGSADGGSADPELDAFRAALDGHSPSDPDALVADVVAAGFARSAIERTEERDSLGRPVTFLEIAVLLGDTCLVGQVGDGEPLALRAAALGGGRCLVGDVIALD